MKPGIVRDRTTCGLVRDEGGPTIVGTTPAALPRSLRTESTAGRRARKGRGPGERRRPRGRGDRNTVDGGRREGISGWRRNAGDMA